MVWCVSHPLLSCLPVLCFFCLHCFLSAGLLNRKKPGVGRFLLYLLSALFCLCYLLLFNQSFTLATTRVWLDHGTGRLIYRNQYGAVGIEKTGIEAVVVKGNINAPELIWVISKDQVFYLDSSFSNLEAFLPEISRFVELAAPHTQGDERVYRGPANQNGGGFKLQKANNAVKGNTVYYLPWLCLVPAAFYRWGLQAWNGRTRLFAWLWGLYALPLLALGLVFRPGLSLALFLLFYPFYLLLAAAMCLPETAKPA